MAGSATCIMAMIQLLPSARKFRPLLLLLTAFTAVEGFHQKVFKKTTSTRASYRTNDSPTFRTRSLLLAAEQGAIDAEATTSVDPVAASLKAELIDLANRTERGFRADNEDRKQARRIILDLAKFNPTREPAQAYYDGCGSSLTSVASIAGKWTLIYTDAPDITGLDSGNVLAELGRIGQDCKAPYIKNVIEWKRPSWAAALPGAGSSSESPRVLQKVVCEAKADVVRPTFVDLQLAGFQLETDPSKRGEVSLRESIEQNGLIAGLLQNRPIDLNGPVNAPFGTFEVLYLDDELRINKTGQNHVAVNMRMEPGEEWF